MNTAQDTVVLLNVLMWKFCENAHVCVCAKFPHQEIRWIKVSYAMDNDGGAIHSFS